MPDQTDSAVLVFEGFRLDLQRRILFSPTGAPVKLTARVLETLVFMTERPGALLSRDALMDAIWPDDAVEANNLSQNIARLRRLFREKPGENRFIETVPGRGYRFIAQVRAEHRSSGFLAEGSAPLRNAAAARLYQQALRILQRPTASNCASAIDALEAALALEKDSALAWAWLADAHLLSVNTGCAGSERLEAAEQCARHALGLDPNVAVAHVVIASVHAQRGEWLASEFWFTKAISLNEADAMARTLHAAFVLQQVGHIRRSVAQVRVAYDLMPDDPRMLMNLAMANSLAGHDDEALHAAGLAISFGYPESAYPLPLVFMYAAARARRLGEAAVRASQLLNAPPFDPEVAKNVYDALDARGSCARAIEAVSDLLARSFEDVVAASGLVLLLAQWLTQLGRADLAFDAVHRVLDADARGRTTPPNWQGLWLPEMRPFRADGRFLALAIRLGFSKYWDAWGPPDP